jgi:hypothetical protein
MTRALTTVETADVTAERNRLAWNLPRTPATVPVARTSFATRDDGSPQHVLDWNAFRSLHFPEARRHDLEALTAYGTYTATRGGETP